MLQGVQLRRCSHNERFVGVQFRHKFHHVPSRFISGVMSPLNMGYRYSLVTLLISPLITTHEPPSRGQTAKLQLLLPKLRKPQRSAQKADA